jgi:hypothetical protein
MLTNHRLVALVVVPLLVAAALVEHDGIAIALSALGLTIALVAIGVTLWTRRSQRRT